MNDFTKEELEHLNRLIVNIVQNRDDFKIEHVRPLCWKCKDLVPVFEADRCFRTNQIYLTAKCHGEIESHMIPGDFFSSNYVEQSFAFHPDNKIMALDMIE